MTAQEIIERIEKRDLTFTKNLLEALTVKEFIKILKGCIDTWEELLDSDLIEKAHDQGDWSLIPESSYDGICILACGIKGYNPDFDLAMYEIKQQLGIVGVYWMMLPSIARQPDVNRRLIQDRINICKALINKFN